MLCSSCLGHFQYSNRIHQQFSPLKFAEVEALKQSPASEDVIRRLQQDADTFKEATHDLRSICPWFRGELGDLPKEVLDREPEIKIWDNPRSGVDIAEKAQLGCGLCSRICTLASYMPKFQRSNSEDHEFQELPPQVPSPENIKWIEVESWLELKPASLKPQSLRFLFRAIRGSCDYDWLDFSLFLRHDGNGLSISTPTGMTSNDPSCLRFLANALSLCLQSHTACRQENLDRWIPSRLIEIRELENVRLVARDELRTMNPDKQVDYFTLSHVWGLEQFLTLTTHNLPTLVKGIQLSMLPVGFQHAVELARQLGGQYLWIDSLCIIQDSPEDWAAESRSMDQVYANGICNLAACDNTNSNQGLYYNRDPLMGLPLIVDVSWDDYLETFTALTPWFEMIIDHAPLYKRGWVAQERQLSPRTIHLTVFPVWECRDLVLSETFPTPHVHGTCGPLTMSTKLSIDFTDWNAVIENYSGCALTKDGDKLIALCGIAKALSKKLGQQYFAGIWGSNLLQGLLWQVYKYLEGMDMDTVRYRNYVAPSWSWASVDGPVYPFTTSIDAPLVEILDVQTQSISGDQFGQLTGGHLTVRGILFEFPPLAAFMDDLERFRDRPRFDDWAMSLDDCGDDYYKNKTWFLPLAVAPAASRRLNLEICGILIQEMDDCSETTVFTRVGFAIVANDGEIANSTWYLNNWILRPWSPEYVKIVTLK
ncbi:heterokaryon incompatibility protein-domain-containing protein [Thelonectria olida]|uniref:Heterokaryon incompatibility protein-domain-containing protein n=1 Tax=Thelonectria olida TaxID=1576542 RepID=A0A9P8VPR4_9HYPO|nr:heterokaryon incompatibility protein-domain-containing protein [Thelonectria olida]